ncbi:MAG: flagellin [Phycisphaerales bacterium]|nr:flagellin [Phycisphaerales bacterium]
MSNFPTSYSRAPSLLFTAQSLNNINSSNIALGRLSNQLASGLDILRPSDDPVRSAAISTLDGRIEHTNQILQNLDFAGSSVGTLDQILADAKALVDEASSVASSQINSDPETRESQAIIIDSLIDSLFSIANQESLVGHVFGGSAPGRQPIIYDRGAYRFVGEVGGLTAALGSASNIPLTLGVGNAIGELSNRMEGVVDLNPNLTENTLLTDLNGANNVGANAGVLEFSYNGGQVAQVDLAGAVTIGDVVDRLNAAVQQYETDNSVTVLGPSAFSISGSTISADIPGGSLEFFDIAGSSTASDLGLVTDPPTSFTAGNPTGVDLDPNLTLTTPVSALAGLGGAPLGSIQLKNNGATHTIDLSGAQTFADIKSAIESGNTGVRVLISEDKQSINIVTESAGTQSHALSISEVVGGGATAELLGIRTFVGTTKLSDFNDGDGVSVVSGRTDPLTGLVDPSLNTDFEIKLGDGFSISIDLSPSDINSVDTVVAAINAQADAQLTAAGRPTTDFSANVGAISNGIEFNQSAAIAAGGQMSIRPVNNSQAAEGLGFMDAKNGAGNTLLRSEDRATIRVNNLFSHLLDLSEALKNDDTFGIEIATKRLGESQDHVIQARSTVGGYARRLDDETRRQQDRVVFDEAIRSQLRDLDYASASSEFAQLQLQLQAGLSVAAQTQQLTLLDFLG